MDGESYFLTVAQVAVAIGGFAGLLTVLNVDDSPNTKHGRALILEISLATTAFALLPFPLHALIQGHEWQISSAALGSYLAITSIYHLHKLLVLHEKPRTPNLMIFLLAVASTVLIVFQGWNVWIGNTYSVYELALLYLLAVTGYQFFLFVVEPEPSKRRVDDPTRPLHLRAEPPAGSPLRPGSR